MVSKFCFFCSSFIGCCSLKLIIFFSFKLLELHDVWCSTLKTSVDGAILPSGNIFLANVWIFVSKLVSLVTQFTSLLTTGQFTFTSFPISSKGVANFTVTVGLATISSTLVHTASVLIGAGILYCNTKKLTLIHINSHADSKVRKASNTAEGKTVKTECFAS